MVYMVCNRNQYWVISSRFAKSWNNIKILMLFHDFHVRPWFVKVLYFLVDYCIETSKEKCAFMVQVFFSLWLNLDRGEFINNCQHIILPVMISTFVCDIAIWMDQSDKIIHACLGVTEFMSRWFILQHVSNVKRSYLLSMLKRFNSKENWWGSDQRRVQNNRRHFNTEYIT